MVVAKKFIYAKAYEGMPSRKNYQLIKEELPELKDGEYLAEAVYLSVDPYMRGYVPSLRIGDIMPGSQVAKIIESKSPNFPVGKYIVASFGWRSHTISREGESGGLPWDSPKVLSFEENIPVSLALGALGMPGNTAYFGLLDVCKAKAGETVVVSAAAGGVGHHVGQIAKIIGCTVIGIAGSDQKRQWLKSLGFDHAINYKTQDVKRALSEAAPKGVDCYFDSVGGEISSSVIAQMNANGRIAVCGATSCYVAENMPKATMIQSYVLSRFLTMRGFAIVQYLDRWDEGVAQNVKWIQEGKFKYEETITEGFENMADGLIGIMNGDNIGKAIVKV